MYLNVMIKLFVCVIAAFVYIRLAERTLCKPALFICMGLTWCGAGDYNTHQTISVSRKNAKTGGTFRNSRIICLPELTAYRGYLRAASKYISPWRGAQEHSWRLSPPHRIASPDQREWQSQQIRLPDSHCCMRAGICSPLSNLKPGYGRTGWNGNPSMAVCWPNSWNTGFSFRYRGGGCWARCGIPGQQLRRRFDAGIAHRSAVRPAGAGRGSRTRHLFPDPRRKVVPEGPETENGFTVRELATEGSTCSVDLWK